MPLLYSVGIIMPSTPREMHRSPDSMFPAAACSSAMFMAIDSRALAVYSGTRPVGGSTMIEAWPMSTGVSQYQSNQ